MAVEITVDFDASTQSLSAERCRISVGGGKHHCQIDKSGARYICRLTPTGQIDSEGLRLRYLELVTDENVREGLRAKTEPVRNLILALAFGSLATQSQDTP